VHERIDLLLLSQITDGVTRSTTLVTLTDFHIDRNHIQSGPGGEGAGICNSTFLADIIIIISIIIMLVY
jgi:hypothetical protein